MTCVEFQRRLSAYMDGELSRWKRWKVETHVRGCAECAGMLRELVDVDQCLTAGVEHCQERSAARDSITAAVMGRLPAMPPASRPRPAMRVWATGIAVAALQLVAIGGAYWWGFTHGTQSPVHGGNLIGVLQGPKGEPAGSKGATQVNYTPGNERPTVSMPFARRQDGLAVIPDQFRSAEELKRSRPDGRSLGPPNPLRSPVPQLSGGH